MAHKVHQEVKDHQANADTKECKETRSKAHRVSKEETENLDRRDPREFKASRENEDCLEIPCRDSKDSRASRESKARKAKREPKAVKANPGLADSRVSKAVPEVRARPETIRPCRVPRDFKANRDNPAHKDFKEKPPPWRGPKARKDFKEMPPPFLDRKDSRVKRDPKDFREPNPPFPDRKDSREKRDPKARRAFPRCKEPESPPKH